MTAVLWDADGVLQQVPASWFDLLADLIGENEATGLLDVLLPRMDDCLRGRVSMRAFLPEALAARGLEAVTEKVSEVWGTIDVVDGSREVVRRLRPAGITGHLVTNQDDLRTSYMRERMGYDGLLDSAYYSSEVGHAKPDPELFTAVAADLGTGFDELLLVDDTLANVETARALGLRSVLWHHREGVDALLERLDEQGLAVP